MKGLTGNLSLSSRLYDEDGKPFETSHPLHFHHFAWPTSETFLAVSYSADNKDSTVMYFRVPEADSDAKEIRLRCVCLFSIIASLPRISSILS